VKFIKWAEATSAAPDDVITDSLTLTKNGLSPMRINPTMRTMIAVSLLWCLKYEGKRELVPRTALIKRIVFSNAGFSRKIKPLKADIETITGTTRQCAAHKADVHIPAVSRKP
jgi:hypothetical protein